MIDLRRLANLNDTAKINNSYMHRRSVTGSVVNRNQSLIITPQTCFMRHDVTPEFSRLQTWSVLSCKPATVYSFRSSELTDSLCIITFTAACSRSCSRHRFPESHPGSAARSSSAHAFHRPSHSVLSAL